MFWEKVHLPPYVTCCISCVGWQILLLLFSFFYIVVDLVVGGSVINGALSPIDNAPSSFPVNQCCSSSLFSHKVTPNSVPSLPPPELPAGHSGHLHLLPSPGGRGGQEGRPARSRRQDTRQHRGRPPATHVNRWGGAPLRCFYYRQG